MSDLSHPCKETCSGWQQGYEAGREGNPKDRCPCGGVILADTEDCPTPLCCECFDAIKEVK